MPTLRKAVRPAKPSQRKSKPPGRRRMTPEELRALTQILVAVIGLLSVLAPLVWSKP